MYCYHPHLVVLVAITSIVSTAPSSYLGNQWIVEDQFCATIDRLQQLCECVVGEDNRLSLLCSGSKVPSEQKQELRKTLNQAATYSNLIISELMLTNLDQIVNLEPFPNVSIQQIRIVGADHLQGILGPVPVKLANSIQQIEVTNTSSLSSSLFDLPNLRTLLLSGVPLASTSFESFNTGQCLPIKHISFNDHCDRPLTLVTLPASSLADLCHIRVLDLSCLGLRQLQPKSLQLTQVKNIARRIILDLSHNRFVEVEQIFTTILSGFHNQFHVNLNFNPIIVWNQSIVQQFLATTEDNQIEAWPDSTNPALDCKDCRNKWLQGQAWARDSYCRDGNKITPLSKANFQHC